MEWVKKNLGTVIVIFALIYLADTSILQAASESDLVRAVLSGEINEVKNALNKGYKPRS